MISILCNLLILVNQPLLSTPISILFPPIVAQKHKRAISFAIKGLAYDVATPQFSRDGPRTRDILRADADIQAGKVDLLGRSPVAHGHKKRQSA